MPIFDNFRLLKESMQLEGWNIDTFAFRYKEVDYIVLAKLYLEKEKKPKYSLMKVEFLRENNWDECLTIPVNSNGFITDAKTLRIFFGIEYGKNLGDILNQFNIYFSRFIPQRVNPVRPINFTNAILNSLSKSDGEDPNKIYCFGVKRNPKGEFRTIFNDNKTRILRPKLYERFKTDKTISFCYSTDILNEKTDEEILRNFTNKNINNYP